MPVAPLHTNGARRCIEQPRGGRHEALDENLRRAVVTSGIAAASCGIGDWGKTGYAYYEDACGRYLLGYVCGGTLGNEMIVTGVWVEQQTGACQLT